MSISSATFTVYEKLAAAKMNALVTSINAHIHDGTSGVKVEFADLDGYLQASQISNGLITGAMIASNSITSSHIVNGTIVIDDININTGVSNSLKVSATGYALYAA
jgi:predicted glutamine amidotransferase